MNSISPTIPPNSIKVVPSYRNGWEFQFPRLDERAYDMFHAALEDFDVDRFEEAERSLRLLLEEFPEFIDAYQHLAIIQSETGRSKEARRTWETAVRIGRRAFPKTFKAGRHRLPWVIIENRPFLRVYHSWGLQLLKEKKISDALAVFNEILSMNPNDNQGIRALAIDCYFQLRQPSKVLAVCKRYRGDAMEEVLYGLPLALLQLGREEEARHTLNEAVEMLPNVSIELLKKTHRPPKGLRPDRITHGGADQAYYYWERYGRFWKNTKRALEFLASTVRNR